MLPILSSSQIREADDFTLAHEPISSIDLMERAAGKCTEWIQKKFTTEISFLIFCGVGNNGGDGLAICRLLLDKGYRAKALLIGDPGKLSADCEKNFSRLKETYPACIEENPKFPIAPVNATNTILIDALFGTGLNRSLQSPYVELIQQMNQAAVPIISIDIPSGLFAEYSDEIATEKIVRASFTLTFQFPKLTFLLPDFGNFTGELNILDIGLHADFIKRAGTSQFFIEALDFKNMLQKRKPFSHKGNYGHALLIAGSEAKMGAAVLCTKACLRSGSGLVSVLVPNAGRTVVLTTLPEAMLLEADEKLAANTDLSPFSAVGIGPGLGKNEGAVLNLKLLIQNTTLPLVLDADALNILAENKTWIGFFKNEVILTPHVKEFERLTEKAKNSYHRLQLAKDFSIKNKVYIVLKGKYTCISCPDGLQYFNSTGNPGMAKGGSGDVLTGIITGFLAQGYSAKEACILGTYLHGLAGDIAAHKLSEQAMIASDIISNLPDAFNFLNA